MLLKPDQERVQILLKDTMTLLCKNGLNFDCKFRIEALVGITLDDKSVCLMKFDELVELQKTDGLDETQTDDDEKSSNRKRRKKIKKEKADLSKEDGDKSDGSDTGDDVLSNSGTDITSTSFNSSMPPPQSHHHHGVKRKLDDGEQDLIVVKEEQSSLWDKSQDYGVQDHDGSFASSSDMAQDMVGSPDGVVWSPLSSVSQGMASGHSRTATVTSSAKDGTSHMPGDSTQQAHPGPYVCKYCGKRIASKQYLRRHENKHMGKFDFLCAVCSKGFLSKEHLVSHMSTVHSGLKTVRCSFCDEKFFYRNQLKRHMQIKHPSEIKLKTRLSFSDSSSSTPSTPQPTNLSFSESGTNTLYSLETVTTSYAENQANIPYMLARTMAPLPNPLPGPSFMGPPPNATFHSASNPVSLPSSNSQLQQNVYRL